ncbi:MAG: hypothetical protein MHPSP_001576, partial [Paramarteilia canceri]
SLNKINSPLSKILLNNISERIKGRENSAIANAIEIIESQSISNEKIIEESDSRLFRNNDKEYQISTESSLEHEFIELSK